MKKSIIYVGVGLIALSLISMLVFNSNPGNQKLNSSFEKPLEPTFTKEGTLQILDGLSREVVQEVDIEIADDDASIEIGMMYRRSMKDTEAMLFIFPREEPRSFWMRNTYVSLDIVFVDAQQKILNIQANAVPLSDKSLPSIGNAQYVLELKGGFCATHNIKAGDYISFEKTKKSV